MRSKRPSASLILSIIAVVAACAGSATAATMITGASIKDASITGADIKNRSVARKDLKRGIALRGPQGPKGDTGATGAAGATGATGARGPSDAKLVHRANVALDNPGICFPPATCDAIPAGVTTSVAQGSYVVFGKVQAEIPDNVGTNGVRCTLTAPGMSDVAEAIMGDNATDNAAGHRTGDQQQASLTLQAAFTAPAGGASPTLKCVGTNIFGGAITAEAVKLTTIQVADLAVAEVTE